VYSVLAKEKYMHGALMSVYRALLQVHGALMSVCRAVL